MELKPQNLINRANAAGKSVKDFAEKTASNVESQIRSSSNIITNAVNSSVGALASDIEGAISFINSATSANTFTTDILSADYSGGPIKNLLGQFASYNYIFTFGPLTNAELANPDTTYRKNGPSIVVLRSGGTGANKVNTLYENNFGITTEYFIDNVEIGMMISANPSTKQTNATNISFEVVEPMSMGLFLQTLQVAAMKAGHSNYQQAPFLLTVEFVGWDDRGNSISLPQTRRMFPLKLSNTTFNVTEQGSVYSVTALPYQEIAFADEVQGIKTDLDLEGSTLLEMLQTGPNSLATQMNSREVELEQSKSKSTGDQYVILFPKTRSSQEETFAEGENNDGATTESSAPGDASGIRDLTDKQKKELFEAFTGIQTGELPADFDQEVNKVLGLVVRRSAVGESIREFAEDEENCNDIGKSQIAKSFLDSGKAPFGKPAFVEDKENPGTFKRGNITISNEAKKIQFSKGTKIQDIIEELVLISDYGRKFVTETPDENGFKTWFKIEAQVYNVTDSDNEKKTGTSPKVYVYRVVPYKVHASKISGPSDVPPGYKKLKQQILKEYNYIYTGKNDDILSFDIDINSAFYTAITADFGQSHADAVTSNQDAAAAQPETPVHKASDGRTDVASQSGSSTTAQAIGSDSGNKGGGAQTHPETQVARAFNEAIVNSNTDLVSAEFEIWGDPYYIADSGMGNYNASEIAGKLNVNSDGVMDYQNGEVDIVINFRTPVDIGGDGNLLFPSLGSKPVGAFSGIYMVTTVTNKFSGGKFTQELVTLRRRNQETDTGGAEPLENSVAVVEGGAEALLAPVVEQAVGAFTTEGFDPAAGSIGGQGGIASQGSTLANVASDINSAVSKAKGAAAAAQQQLNNTTKGKIPAGVTDAAKKAVDTASGIFGNDPGGA